MPIEDHADSMAGLSSAFLSVKSFDDMKNVYQLETAVAKLIDVDHDGKHWGNEIRRAQHFFQEELYRHWLKQRLSVLRIPSCLLQIFANDLSCMQWPGRTC